MRNGLKRLFEAGDGRLASNGILYVRKGERVNIISTGWGCDEGEIIVYKFLHYPDNHNCEAALIAMWTEDVNCGPLQTVEVPRVRLTKANAHDIIDEHGQYLLHRARGAENVAVYGKYDVQP